MEVSEKSGIPYNFLFHANRSFEQVLEVCGNFQNDLYLAYGITIVT